MGAKLKAYACVYSALSDGTTSVLVCKKREKGYFFRHENGDGVVYVNGTALPGAGGDCLPGGWLRHHESLGVGAAREWLEATNYGPLPQNARTQSWGAAYGAAYFRAEPNRLEEICGHLTAESLHQAALAAQGIKARKIKKYSEIKANFPESPANNDIESIEIWNLEERWPEIQKWHDPASGLNWYYNILKHLKEVARPTMVA